MARTTTIGVLALQGAFDLHRKALARLGVDYRLVKTAADFAVVDALIIPGGETTTMRWFLKNENLTDDLVRFVNEKPVMGTCAGMILLAKKVAGDIVDDGLGVIDIDVRRNAYGRQVHSHTGEGRIDLGEGPRSFPMVFIRAPRIERVGRDVQILGTCDDEPTMVAAGNVLVMSFHPELSGSDAVHEYFIQTFVKQFDSELPRTPAGGISQ